MMVSEKATLTVLHSLKRKVFLLAVCMIMALTPLVLLDIMIVCGANQLESTKEGKTVSDLPCAIGNQIDISPPVPTASDVIEITSSGWWCDTCIPVYQSHQVTGNVIKIYAGPDFSLPPPVCCPAFTPWTLGVEVGPLPVGTYTVEVYASGWYCPSFFDSTSFIVIPAPISAVLSTDGGALTHHYPGHTTSLTVPPGALSAASVFTVSYRIPPATIGQLQGMDHFFDLTGTQTIFTTPLTLTVHYSESVRGTIISGTENLYRWQNGQWVTDNVTLTDRWPGGLLAQITHLSLFGVLGETHRAYLPIVLK